MCNAVSTSEREKVKNGMRASAKEAVTRIHRKCCHYAENHEDIKQLLLMDTGYFTLDSPLYLTNFHIVTNSVRVC